MLKIGCSCGGELVHTIMPGRTRVESCVATCPECLTTYRLDVALTRLDRLARANTKPREPAPVMYPSRNPHAYGAKAIDEITRATYPRKASR